MSETDFMREQTGFDGLVKLCRSVEEYYTVTADQTGLNKTEREVIKILYEEYANGNKIISTNLAERLGVTRSAISQMVDKMVEKGYVVREASGRDKKIAYICLSQREKDKANELLKKRSNAVVAAVDAFGYDKTMALCASLNELMKILEKKN